jgi:hypothetical protein
VIHAISPSGLASLVVDRMGATRRVAIDGPPPARPAELAESIVDGLHALGRKAIHVRTVDFLRPASTRLELGRTNPDSYYERWVDLGTLNREVLAHPDRVLPTFWNPQTDRATRAQYVELGPDGVVVLSGDLLLGAGLELDFAVYLQMSLAALARRLPAESAWTLPAYQRYAAEVEPERFANVVVRVNDPNHPAIVT